VRSGYRVVADTSVITSTAAPRRLLRILGLTFGVAVVVGGTVGIGILRAPGTVAGRLESPSLIYLVWLLGGGYALIATNVYAELASAIPRAGGPYLYVRRGLGEFAGFAAGWGDFAINTVAIAWTAVACSEFLVQLLPVLMGREHLLAPALIVLLTAVNSLGVKTGSGLQQALTLGKVLLLLGLVVAGFVYSGEAPEPMAGGRHLGLGASAIAVVVSVQFVLETYAGYNNACYFGEELTDPGRNLPRSMFAGTLLVLVLYLLINAALLHVLSPAQLATSTLPAADALAKFYGPVARTAVTVVAAASALALLHGSVLLTPRILYGMSCDGLFRQSGTYVTRTGVPLFALWVSAAVGLAFATLGSFEFLFAVTAVLTVLLDPLCALALFVLRRREPALARPYRSFGYPWLPGLVLITGSSLFIAYFVANPKPSLIACGLLAAALPLFSFVRRSRERPLTGKLG
jgi:APA family basic amino acid/polyamine antiporter